MKQFKIALVQTQPGSRSAEQNIQAASDWVAEAASQGAKLVCLPELFNAPYFCQVEDDKLFDLAESIPGPSVEALGAAAKNNEVVVIAPIFEKRAPGVYHNSVVVLDADGSTKGTYRKMHIPDDPGYYEKFYFTPGDLGFQTFETAVGKIGCLICWDQWFPEAARLTALKGANVLIYPTAIGWHPHEKEQYGAQQTQAWQTIQRGHAIANGVYVAAINRIGIEKNTPDCAGIEFWGQSFLANPQGTILGEASADKEEILLGDIDIDEIETIRRNWPFLRDRRIEAYNGIQSRYLEG